MNEKAFGFLIAGAVASILSGNASAADGKAAAGKAATPTATSPKAEGKVEMVKCFSSTCAGAFEYKGEKNSCDQKKYAMEVPKSICDTKKGLKIAAD